jgi:hypothetical protein
MIGGFSAALPLAYNACINEAHFAYLHGREAGLKEGLGAAGTKGAFPDADEEDDEDPEIQEALDRITDRIEVASRRYLGLLEKLKLKIAAEARASWEAFSKLSREGLGLEPKKLVKMSSPPCPK